MMAAGPGPTGTPVTMHGVTRRRRPGSAVTDPAARQTHRSPPPEKFNLAPGCRPVAASRLNGANGAWAWADGVDRNAAGFGALHLLHLQIAWYGGRCGPDALPAAHRQPASYGRSVCVRSDSVGPPRQHGCKEWRTKPIQHLQRNIS
jgi:hypothetical protein